MTELPDEWQTRLGPAVLPFERTQFARKVLNGEAIIFVDYIVDINRSGVNGVTVVDTPLITGDNPPMQGKYLWIIDKSGLKLIPKATPNPYAARGVVCHTNITGGDPAYQGGELWFGADGNVYVNNRSGRYGANTLAQRDAVLDYFRSLGLNPVQLRPVV